MRLWQNIAGQIKGEWAAFATACGVVAAAAFAVVGKIWTARTRHLDHADTVTLEREKLRAAQEEAFRVSLLGQIDTLHASNIKLETSNVEYRERLYSVKLALEVAREEREEQRRLKHDVAGGLNLSLLTIQQYRDKHRANFDDLDLPALLKLGTANRKESDNGTGSDIGGQA